MIRTVSRRPFTPNPEFPLSTAQHKQLIEALFTAARKSFQLVVLTGPEGVGKTVLIDHLSAAAPPDVAVGRLSTDGVERGGFIRITISAGPTMAFESGTAIPDEFKVFLAGQRHSNRHLLLIMDNVDKVADSVLNALNSLLDTRLDGIPSLTMLLAGSPKLLPLLDSPRFGALIHHRAVNFEFLPMTAEETAAYVRRRLQMANLDAETFEEAALQVIHQAAGGLPKQVNMLCSHALAAMSREGKQIVDHGLADALVTQSHGKRAARDTSRGNSNETRSTLMRSVCNISDDKIIQEQSDYCIPVIRPCEFVFLSRNPTELAAPALRTGIDHNADYDLSENREADTPPARARMRGSTSMSHHERTSPDVAQVSVTPADAPSAQTPTAPPTATHRCPVNARLRPAYSLLSGVVVVTVVGFTVARIIGGGNTGGYPPGKSSEPDRSATAVLSSSAPRLAFKPSSPLDGSLDLPVFHDLTEDDAVVPSEAGDRGASSGIAVIWRDAGALPEKWALAVDNHGLPPPDRDGADRLFRQGLKLSVVDSTAAAVAFSRAAIRGHGRSAYYLGQMYETGDGVPVDTALARAWYELAGGQSHARERLDELAARRGVFEERGTPSGGTAPQQLFAERSATGVLELVWTGGPGAEPTDYIVELAEMPGSFPSFRTAVSVSALRLPSPDFDEVWWRVIAGEGSIASVWQHVPYAD